MAKVHGRWSFHLSGDGRSARIYKHLQTGELDVMRFTYDTGIGRQDPNVIETGRDGDCVQVYM